MKNNSSVFMYMCLCRVGAGEENRSVLGNAGWAGEELFDNERKFVALVGEKTRLSN